jgi:hypothetical protein
VLKLHDLNRQAERFFPASIMLLLLGKPVKT